MKDNDVFIQKELRKLSPEEVQNINTEKVLKALEELIIEHSGNGEYHRISANNGKSSIEIVTPTDQMSLDDVLSQAMYFLSFCSDEVINRVIVDHYKEVIQKNKDDK